MNAIKAGSPADLNATLGLRKKLFLFFLINPLLLNLLLLTAFSTSWRDTVLFEAFIFAHRAANVVLQRPVQHGEDSWKPMIDAYSYARSEGDQPLYDRIFFEDKIKFQYPPTALLIVHAVQWLPMKLPRLFDWISWFAVAGMCLAVSWILLYRISGVRSRRNDFFTVAIVTLFCLTFHPLMKGLSLGQIQTWINCLVALLLLCWVKQKEGAAGLLAGIITLLKPHYVILLLWGAFRKKREFSLSFIVTLLAGILVSVAVFGWRNHLNYLDVLSFLARHGESYQANQSVNGVLNRLFESGTILRFDKHAFPSFNPFVYYSALITGVALIAAALLLPQRGNVFDLSIVLLTGTIASPIAWDHHYGILMPMYALLVVHFAGDNRRLLFLAGGYVLTSNYLAFGGAFADPPANLLLSYLFGGSLIALLLLYSAAEVDLRSLFARKSKNTRIKSHIA